MWPRSPGPATLCASRKWSPDPLQEQENRAAARFVKPSAGLEPATPSLPWRSRHPSEASPDGQSRCTAAPRVVEASRSDRHVSTPPVPTGYPDPDGLRMRAGSNLQQTTRRDRDRAVRCKRQTREVRHAPRRIAGSRSRSVGTRPPIPSFSSSQPSSFPSFQRIAKSPPTTWRNPRGIAGRDQRDQLREVLRPAGRGERPHVLEREVGRDGVDPPRVGEAGTIAEAHGSRHTYTQVCMCEVS
jgi:hypothetical protein